MPSVCLCFLTCSLYCALRYLSPSVLTPMPQTSATHSSVFRSCFSSKRSLILNSSSVCLIRVARKFFLQLRQKNLCSVFPIINIVWSYVILLFHFFLVSKVLVSYSIISLKLPVERNFKLILVSCHDPWSIKSCIMVLSLYNCHIMMSVLMEGLLLHWSHSVSTHSAWMHLSNLVKCSIKPQHFDYYV